MTMALSPLSLVQEELISANLFLKNLNTWSFQRFSWTSKDAASIFSFSKITAELKGMKNIESLFWYRS
jgi:hypothetical protein